MKDKDNQKGTAGQHEPEGKNRTTGTTKPSQRSAIIPLPKSQLHERRTEAFAGGLTESTIDKTESPLQHVRKVHQSKPIRSRSHIDVLETDEVPAMATRLTSPLKNNISKDLTSLSESSVRKGERSVNVGFD